MCKREIAKSFFANRANLFIFNNLRLNIALIIALISKKILR